MRQHARTHPAELPQVLAVEDVAEILDLSLAAVRRLLLRGELPGRKVGKRWRILRSRLEEFLAEESRCR